MSDNNDENELTKEDLESLQRSEVISEAFESTPILPGESEETYETGLADLIAELDAKTVLQVYLAEKIFDCLWWIRRYEQQKRATVIVQMAALTKEFYVTDITPEEVHVREGLMINSIDDATINTAARAGHSISSLRQQALATKRAEIQQLDQQIALQTKILAGLQASYEVAYNRKSNIERLKLQNDQLRKGLSAIEIVQDAPKDEKPKASRRKSS